MASKLELLYLCINIYNCICHLIYTPWTSHAARYINYCRLSVAFFANWPKYIICSLLGLSIGLKLRGRRIYFWGLYCASNTFWHCSGTHTALFSTPTSACCGCCSLVHTLFFPLPGRTDLALRVLPLLATRPRTHEYIHMLVPNFFQRRSLVFVLNSDR